MPCSHSWERAHHAPAPISPYVTSTPTAASPPVKTVVGAVGLVVALVGFIIVMYFGFIRGGEGHS